MRDCVFRTSPIESCQIGAQHGDVRVGADLARPALVVIVQVKPVLFRAKRARAAEGSVSQAASHRKEQQWHVLSQVAPVASNG